MLIAGIATLGAGCGTFLAFYKQLGQSLSVIIGYAVLLISSVLIGLFLTGVSGDAKRTVFLVVLVLLFNGLLLLLAEGVQIPVCRILEVLSFILP